MDVFVPLLTRCLAENSSRSSGEAMRKRWTDSMAPDPAPRLRSLLVVDSDPDVLIFIGRLLDSHGLRPLFARSVTEAVAIAARNYVPIDLILSNITLDQFSGPEAVNRVRKFRPGLNALYMSAWIDTGVIRIDLMRGGGLDRSDGPRTLFGT